MEVVLPAVYKPSSMLLNNRNVFQRLIQQKKYAEAHAIKGEIEDMEQVEQMRHDQMRQVKVTKAMQKVLAKQQIEMAALHKKLLNQQCEQARQRAVETVQLEKKFKNAIKEMTNKHNQAVVQHDKFYEKNISNRPRYQPEFSQRQSMADSSMRSSASRRLLMSAKGGRK